MIFGLGPGEGEQAAGAASASATGNRGIGSVRTRSQLESHRQKSDMEKQQEATEEAMDESLLDEEESETEGHEAGTAAAAEAVTKPEVSAPKTQHSLEESQKASTERTESSAEDDDRVFVDESDLVSVKREPKNFDIGNGHATVIAARKAASSRRQLNPSPTTVKQGEGRPSFTWGGTKGFLDATLCTTSTVGPLSPPHLTSRGWSATPVCPVRTVHWRGGMGSQ